MLLSIFTLEILLFGVIDEIVGFFLSTKVLVLKLILVSVPKVLPDKSEILDFKVII